MYSAFCTKLWHNANTKRPIRSGMLRITRPEVLDERWFSPGNHRDERRKRLRKPATHRCWESDTQHPFNDSGFVVADLVVSEGPGADRAFQATNASINVNSVVDLRGTKEFPVADQLLFHPHVLPRFSSRYFIGGKTVSLDGNTFRMPCQSSSVGLASRTAAVDERTGRLTKSRWVGRSLTMMRTVA
jgi:hypothetical protein